MIIKEEIIKIYSEIYNDSITFRNSQRIKIRENSIKHIKNLRAGKPVKIVLDEILEEENILKVETERMEEQTLMKSYTVESLKEQLNDVDFDEIENYEKN